VAAKILSNQNLPIGLNGKRTRWALDFAGFASLTICYFVGNASKMTDCKPIHLRKWAIRYVQLAIAFFEAVIQADIIDFLPESRFCSVIGPNMGATLSHGCVGCWIVKLI